MPFRTVFLFTSIALATACADLTTPSELASPQLIALVAEPPSVPLSEEALLDVVVAGPEGAIVPVSVRWRVVGNSGAQVLRLQDDTWVLQAPEELLEGSTYAQLEVTVELEDGETLLGTRTVAIGQVSSSPHIDEVLVSGVATETLVLSHGSDVQLSLTTSPPMREEGIVSWFSTTGELEHYRRTPATLTASEVGRGQLFVVYRDGLGGIAHQSLTIEVTE